MTGRRWAARAAVAALLLGGTLGVSQLASGLWQDDTQLEGASVGQGQVGFSGSRYDGLAPYEVVDNTNKADPIGFVVTVGELDGVKDTGVPFYMLVTLWGRADGNVGLQFTIDDTAFNGTGVILGWYPSNGTTRGGYCKDSGVPEATTNVPLVSTSWTDRRDSFEYCLEITKDPNRAAGFGASASVEVGTPLGPQQARADWPAITPLAGSVDTKILVSHELIRPG
ncbi:MAG: hypothetical protein FWD29_03960 [Micrococcales bacterium]|nr:hypothetical protein [Micrococcales bacterium]